MIHRRHLFSVLMFIAIFFVMEKLAPTISVCHLCRHRESDFLQSYQVIQVIRGTLTFSTIFPSQFISIVFITKEHRSLLVFEETVDLRILGKITAQPTIDFFE